MAAPATLGDALPVDVCRRRNPRASLRLADAAQQSKQRKEQKHEPHEGSP